MDPLTIASILSMVAAAVWSVWTWTADHEEERQLQRDQAAALYVNPYIMTIGQLQLRLRGMLDEDDLADARREHPGPHPVASPFAIETLYVLGSFFGWAGVNLRFGPYTRDRVVVDCYRQLIRIFDRREGFADAAFYFTFPEQVALSAAVMRRVGTRAAVESSHPGFPEFAHPEFATATLPEFENDFRSPESVRAEFYRTPAIRRIVDAIDGADRPERLAGRERLEALRPVLVTLTRHLQRKEGIVLAAPEATVDPKAAGADPAAGKTASKGTTIVNGAAATAGSPEIASEFGAEVLYRMKGRIRLRVPRLSRDPAYAVGLGTRIRKWEDVEAVNVDAPGASLDVRYRPTVGDGDFRQRVLEAIATDDSRAAGEGSTSRQRRRRSV